MRPVFADPKTDFVFKRIFGTEVHKHLLVELLNTLLELDEPHRIVDLKYLTPEQHVPISEFKLSVVDVKCYDQSGRHYVVEMQVLNVEGFEKRVVYNTAKAYVTQLRTGEDYPQLDDVVGVTICDFLLWPEPPQPGGSPVPMLSRWRMQEQHGGVLGLSQIQHVFLELPKYTARDAPRTLLERWVYFFREAENLEVVPPVLAEAPFREALEVARMAGFKAEELELYDRAKIAEQDARGALSLAQRQGREEGRAEGRAEGREEGLAALRCSRCALSWVSSSTPSAKPGSRRWGSPRSKRSNSGSCASGGGFEAASPARAARAQRSLKMLGATKQESVARPRAAASAAAR